MKGILVFKLPEELEEFRDAQSSGQYRSALFDLQNYLRHKLKYEELSEAQDKAIRELQEEFFRITEGLDL